MIGSSNCKIEIKSKHIYNKNIRDIIIIFRKFSLEPEISIAFKNNESITLKPENLDFDDIYFKNRRIKNISIKSSYIKSTYLSVNLDIASRHIYNGSFIEIVSSEEDKYTLIKTEINNWLESIERTNIFNRLFNNGLFVVFLSSAISGFLSAFLIKDSKNYILSIIVGFFVLCYVFIFSNLFPNVSLSLVSEKKSILKYIIGFIGVVILGIISSLIANFIQSI